MEKEVLRERLLEMGADAVGFGTPRVFTEHLTVLKQREALPFEEKDLRRRVDPFVHFPASSSIVCVLQSYDLFTNPLKEGEFKMTSSTEEDYHLAMDDLLQRAQKILGEEGIQSKALCDREGLLDKIVAREAGLGFLGRNSLLIHPRLGSSVHIGYLLTDASWEEDEEDPRSCGNCRRCVKACPVGAIQAEGGIDPLRCLSGVTQNKNALPQYLHGFLYGCDICQRVCPHNTVQEVHHRFLYRREDFALSNREFRRKYHREEFAWIGKKLLLRNMTWNEEEA